MVHVPSSGSGWTRHYTTKADSNRLDQTWYGGNTINAVTYRHDTHGNMLNLNRIETPPLLDPEEKWGLDIRWDWRDMIRGFDLGGGGLARYHYGIDKQRTRKHITRTGGVVEDRIYLGGYELYRSRNAQGAVVEEIESHHLFEGEQRVLLVDDVIITASGTPHPRPDGLRVKAQTLFRYQYSNHLGSACLELDHEAEIISYEEYHPYGTGAYRAMKSGIEAPPKRYRYTGMERDEESGLGYHGVRYYAAALGRWVNCDPEGTSATQTLYVYCASNPLTFHDRMGTREQDAGRFPELNLGGFKVRIEYEKVFWEPPKPQPDSADVAKEREAYAKEYPYPLQTEEFMKRVLGAFPLRKDQWFSDVPTEFTYTPNPEAGTEYFVLDPKEVEKLGEWTFDRSGENTWRYEAGHWWLPEHSHWHQSRTKSTEKYPLDAPLRQTPLEPEVLESLRSDIPESKKPPQTGFGQFDVELGRLEQRVGNFLEEVNKKLQTTASGLSGPTVSSLDEVEVQSRERGLSSQFELPPPPVTPHFGRGLGLNYDFTRGPYDLQVSLGATAFEKTHSYSLSSQSLTPSTFDIKIHSPAIWGRFKIRFGR